MLTHTHQEVTTNKYLSGLTLNCIDCSTTGELTAAFDIILAGLSPSDLLESLTRGIADNNPLETSVKKMELTVETTREISALMNYELQAQGSVLFGYPGLIPSTGQSSFEDKIMRKYPKTLFSVSLIPATDMCLE